MKAEILKSDQLKVSNTLESLGLKDDWLKIVCQRALFAYNQATQHDAINAAGSYAYFAVVRALRDVLCPKGWCLRREKNLEFTINPTNDVGIIVSSGNKDTGIHNGYPKTKNQKGKQTKGVIAHNQMLIWPELENKFEIPTTWILLFHFDTVKQEMRRELSLPIEMDFSELRVSGWNTRIILPPVSFIPSLSLPDNPIYPDGVQPEFEIKIRRREDE